MPALPPATDFTAPTVTQGGFKTAITNLREFLADLLGTTGTKATALSTLGVPLHGVTSKSAAYTVVAADRGLLIDCTGTWTLSLTAAATLGAGFTFAVKNSGTGAITIDPAGSELIDGAATLTLAAGESAFVQCNGTAWRTVGNGGGGVPTGAIMFFPANSVPQGFLKANGALVSRTTYAALFAVIGTTYGAGDGSTTFALPDLRGEFIRCFDDGRGVDSGRAIGSAQTHQMQSHTHTTSFAYGAPGELGAGLATLHYIDSMDVTSSAAGGTSNGSETRPRNIAMLACIKY